MLRLTSASAWVALLFLGILTAALVIWGFYGSIPVRISGLGLILYDDSRLFDLLAPADGTVSALAVRSGETVAAGQAVARLSLPTLEATVRAARDDLALAKEQQAQQDTLAERQIQLHRRSTEDQITTLQKQIASATSDLRYLSDRHALLQAELKQGYVTREHVQKAREAMDAARLRISQARDRITTLRMALQRFEADQAVARLQREQTVADARAALRKAESALHARSLVKSPVAGTVAELDLRPGMRVTAGQQVAVVEQAGGELGAVAFLPLGKGERAAPGMAAQVSPASVQRTLWGSIRARVESIGTLPETRAGVQAVLGNEALTAQMMAGGAPLKARLRLERDPSTYSGLRWSSSKGPPVKIKPGDLAHVSVTVDHKRPIDFVIPLFAPWLRAGTG